MYKRQVLVDQSPISIKQINDNFSAIFLKISGNIDTMDLKDDAVKTDKIADGAITGDKVMDGTLTIVNMEDGFVGDLDLLENAVFTSLASDVSGNSTLIQQNTNRITLQASSIDGLRSNLDIQAGQISAVSSKVDANSSSISSLTVSYDNINATVSTNVRNIGTLESNLDIQAGQISSKVSYTDYNGNEIASLINQRATNVTIDAEKIDLKGVTTIYDRHDDRYYIEMNRGDIYSRGEYGELFSTSSTDYLTSIKLRGSDIISYGLYADALIYPPIDFLDDVQFSGNGPIMPRRKSDKIEIDVWGDGIAIWRAGKEQGFIPFR